MPLMWSLSEDVVLYFGLDAEYEVTRSLVVLVASELINTVVHLPFSLYSTFVIEERHGFNKQTLRLFFMDMAKSLALSAVLGLSVFALILHIIAWGGELFYLYVWAFVCLFSIVMVALAPVLIMPLFNTYVPLPEGELRTAIEKLAGRVGFPLTALYVVDGSQRSAHSNAYFYGFPKMGMRIVLYDTLLKNFVLKSAKGTEERGNAEEEKDSGDQESSKDFKDEIAILAAKKLDVDGINSIIGHELGHYKLSHNLKNFFVQQLYIFVFFWLFGQFLNNVALYRAFGFDTQPTFIGLMLFSFMYSPFEHVFSLAMNFVIRHYEYQADQFSQDLGYQLEGPLVKIHVENLGNMSPDPLYSMYHFSHPTLVERISALQKSAAVKGKKQK
eukprot:TRINITY_DN1251_c0_g1_i1.p1 TRINITY_DN1251_c0_g1~~TRINITY_DN1251_c0_g1_i1.p1  ORF type:complete len:386 (-),score=107.25 TRINITY_DN1251_c0_g1_i1:14-1171(-)